MANANSKVRPALMIMATLITLGVVGIFALSMTTGRDQSDHKASAGAHPVLQERIASNYEKIQIQQQAIIDDVDDIDKKIDRVLDAVEK